MNISIVSRRALPFLILSFGILSCDVRDKGTVAVPDQFTTLAPRLVMANGTPVDTVDSVRVEVSFGDRTVVRSAPFSVGSVKIDSIPVGVKWSMAVKGLRKAADGLHWPVRWQGADTGHASETVRLDTVKLVFGDTTAPVLSGSGLPAKDTVTLANGTGRDTLSFHFPSTDSVYVGAALTPDSTKSGISYYTLSFAVPASVVLSVVDSAKNVALDTFLFLVDTKALDTTTPAISVEVVSVDTAGKTAILKAAPTSGSGGIDSVVSNAGTSSRKKLRSPWLDTVSLISGFNQITDSVYAHNGRVAAGWVTVTLKKSTPYAPPVVKLLTPSKTPDTVGWSSKSVILSWSVVDTTYAVESVWLNGKTLSGSSGIWSDTESVAVGGNTFILKVQDKSANFSYDTVLVYRSPDTTAPVLTRAGSTKDTVLRTSVSKFTCAWTAKDNALSSVKIDGVAVFGNSDAYSREIALPAGDSSWIVIVAVDSSNNTARDSIKIRRLAPPTISPDGAALSASQTTEVAITSNWPTASVQYSTDDSTWKTGVPPVVSTSQILYARAVLDGTRSDPDSAVFLYSPVISVPSGAYSAKQTVSITDSGAAVKYYLGYTPPATLTTYATALSIDTCTILHAVASLGGETSGDATATFAFAPSISPSSGTYADKRTVSVAAAGADSIQVSMDGAVWTKVSNAYTVTASGKYYFRSAINGLVSESSSGTYAITHDTTLSSLAVSANSYLVYPPRTATVYTMDSLPFGTTSATVTAVPNDTAARVTINGGTSGIIALINDTATVSIKVTNGAYAQVYTLSLYAKRSGTFTDSRDDIVYTKVHIGTQIWMAQNLKYRNTDANPTDTVGACYGNDPANCNTYGRLYQWHEAMAVSAGYDSLQLGPGAAYQGICPSGWHIPTDAEWSTLASVGGSDLFDNSSSWVYSVATNSYGFGILPAGYGSRSGSDPTVFGNLGTGAYFWTADETLMDGKWSHAQERFVYNSAHLSGSTSGKSQLESVRCIAN